MYAYFYNFHSQIFSSRQGQTFLTYFLAPWIRLHTWGPSLYSEVSTFFLDTLVSYISSIRIFHILHIFSYFWSLDTQYPHTYFLAIHRIPYRCTLVFCIFCHISLCHTSIPALYSHISPARILHIFTYPISPTYLISCSAISSTYPHLQYLRS